MYQLGLIKVANLRIANFRKNSRKREKLDQGIQNLVRENGVFKISRFEMILREMK